MRVLCLPLVMLLLTASCVSAPATPEIVPSAATGIERALQSSVSLVVDDGGRADGFGSAIVLNEQGYLVTAHHVVDGAMGITVLMAGGRAAVARVVAEDPVGDIAILQTTFVPEAMVPATAASGCAVGDEVISVGNPFGTSRLGGSPSVARGIVSASSRSFVSEKTGRVYLDCIQHDAPTNPGNSGGGIFNARGQLLGMNVLINTPQDTASESGVAFALPAAALLYAAQRLLAGEKIHHGWLGARGYRGVLWMNSQGLGRLGTMLREVEDGSPAYQAGMQAGDVIVSVTWWPGPDAKTWPASLDVDRRDWLLVEDALPVGQQVKVKISRGGRELDFSLTVADRTLRR